MSDIPELTERDFAKAIPASLRRRLIGRPVRVRCGCGRATSLCRFATSTVRTCSRRDREHLCMWEQDRAIPEGPALALLRIAARHPRIVGRTSLRSRSFHDSPRVVPMTRLAASQPLIGGLRLHPGRKLVGNAVASEGQQSLAGAGKLCTCRSESTQFPVGGFRIGEVGAHLHELDRAAGTGQEVDLVPFRGPNVRHIEPPPFQLYQYRGLQRVSNVCPPRSIEQWDQARIDRVCLPEGGGPGRAAPTTFRTPWRSTTSRSTATST